MEQSHSKVLFSMLGTISKMKNMELTPEIFKIWLMALDPYPFEKIRKAFNRFINTESRMPMPADIINIIRGSEKDRALAALIKVDRAIRTHGAYATVVFDDPGITAVIKELGGWIHLCGLTEAELIWWRKDFRERYELGIRGELKETEEQTSPKLPGLFELSNMEAGYPPPPPVLIGDREKCRRLIESEEREATRVRSLVKSAFSQGALKEMPR